METGKPPDLANPSERMSSNKGSGDMVKISKASEESSIGHSSGSGHSTGLQLYTLAFGLSVSYFLILLNSTVVVTVRQS